MNVKGLRASAWAYVRTLFKLIVSRNKVDIKDN